MFKFISRLFLLKQAIDFIRSRRRSGFARRRTGFARRF
jgi:hypothetical protein